MSDVRYAYYMWASFVIALLIVFAGMELVNNSPVPRDSSATEVARARQADRSAYVSVCGVVFLLGLLALCVRACLAL